MVQLWGDRIVSSCCAHHDAYETVLSSWIRSTIKVVSLAKLSDHGWRWSKKRIRQFFYWRAFDAVPPQTSMTIARLRVIFLGGLSNGSSAVVPSSTHPPGPRRHWKMSFDTASRDIIAVGCHWSNHIFDPHNLAIASVTTHGVVEASQDLNTAKSYIVAEPVSGCPIQDMLQDSTGMDSRWSQWPRRASLSMSNSRSIVSEVFDIFEGWSCVVRDWRTKSAQLLSILQFDCRDISPCLILKSLQPKRFFFWPSNRLARLTTLIVGPFLSCLTHTSILKCLVTVAAVTLFAYDIINTFPGEVEFIWRWAYHDQTWNLNWTWLSTCSAKLNLSKMLYLLARYYGFIFSLWACYDSDPGAFLFDEFFLTPHRPPQDCIALWVKDDNGHLFGSDFLALCSRH